jgi:hypothetical protein
VRTRSTGPGLAKPISMPSSSFVDDSCGQKRVNAALEKNLETIVTQVRRTTNKPSQLTQNDLQMFDSTSPISHLKVFQQSREMTPDSINTDSANDESPSISTSLHNGHVYPCPMMSPSTADYMNAYGQLPWPPTVYPFGHQHPALYLSYPPILTPNNTRATFYAPYDPHLIEQHYNSQGLSAYFAQQQQQTATARLFQEQSSSSGRIESDR